MLCYENVKKCNERKREKVRGKKGEGRRRLVY